MNLTQKKYLLKRIREEKELMSKEIRQYYRTPAVTISHKERLEALREGRFKLREDSERYSINTSLFIFEGETPAKVDMEKTDKALNLVSRKASILSDQVMLGSSEEAAEMLESFRDLNWKEED